MTRLFDYISMGSCSNNVGGGGGGLFANGTPLCPHGMEYANIPWVMLSMQGALTKKTLINATPRNRLEIFVFHIRVSILGCFSKSTSIMGSNSNNHGIVN